MDDPYWRKQQLKHPLFPEMEWSRPENKMHAGKLLIIGGNAYGFSAPAEAYAESIRAGIGSARALLPDSIQKLVGIIIEQAAFAPSTPSGSFSQKALIDFLQESEWADGVLVAGELGRNSETAITLEKFLLKSSVAVTITRDAVDYCTSAPQSILHRENTLLVLSLSQLQRLGIATSFEMPVAFSMDLLHLVEWLHVFTNRFPIYLIVKHLDTIFVAVGGQVSTTKIRSSREAWRLKTAAHASVWWLQNTKKPFEALTTAVTQVF